MKAGSWGGTGFPGQRYPGMKHSGKQTRPAPSTAAWAMASSARTTESAGVEGYGRFASAMRNGVMALPRNASRRGAAVSSTRPA